MTLTDGEKRGVRPAETKRNAKSLSIAESDVRAASVLHHCAMLADGWASILCVLPPAEGLALATKHEVAARLLIARGHSGLTERLTPALAAMLSD